MNKQESIEKIKSTLIELKELALSIKGKKELKFQEVKCDDGTLLVTSSDLAVGVEVFTRDAEGNQTPVNDGDYICGGQTITIQSGKVEKLEEVKVEEVVDSPEDDANVNLTEEVKTEEKLEDEVVTEEVIEEKSKEGEVKIEDRVKMLEDGMAKILGVLDQILSKTEATLTEKAELEQKNEELAKKNTELSAEPGDVSVEEKVSKSTVKLSDVDIRIERFKNMAKSL